MGVLSSRPQQVQEPCGINPLGGSPLDKIKKNPRLEVVPNLSKVRVVPPEELSSDLWIMLPNPQPAYIRIKKIGASSLSRYRQLPDGRIAYIASKLHPMNPAEDRIEEFFEIPEYIIVNGKRECLVVPMKYAIKQYWPNQNLVTFITDEGGQFDFAANEILYAQDKGIHQAVDALRNDYPSELEDLLAYRTVKPPKIQMLKERTEGPDLASNETFTLGNGKKQQDYFDAVQREKENLYQQPKATTPQPELVRIFDGNNRLNTGVPSTKETANPSKISSEISNSNIPFEVHDY